MKYSYETIPTKYKKGDVFIVTKDFSYDGIHFYKGDKGMINGYDTNIICAYDIGWYYIIWERDVGGHDLKGECELGHGWTVDSNVISINTEIFKKSL